MQQSNFDNFADDWWKKNGSMKMLHSMHKTRWTEVKRNDIGGSVHLAQILRGLSFV